MSYREELFKEYAEWTTKWVEAEERYKALLPQAKDASKGEKLEYWVPTKESLAELEKIEIEIKEAQDRLREVREEIANLPPEKK